MMAMADSCIYCYEESNFRVKIFSRMKNAGFVPEKGSELFVSKIPPEATVGDLRDFFEPIGTFFEIKLMMCSDGRRNRGFGYVTYMNKGLAQKALQELRHKPFRQTAFLDLQKSIDNCRIFVGGLPIHKTKNEIWNELKNTYDIQNILNVITYRNYVNPMYNRGFAFLEFRTHEQASWFRAKFWDKLFLFGKQLKVDWAVPNIDDLEAVNDEGENEVKILFIRNLDVTLSNREFSDLMLSLVEPNYVEKTYKFKDYAYIHLNSREHAEEALVILENHYKNSLVEISFAKPPNKFTERAFREKALLDRQNKSHHVSPPNRTSETAPNRPNNPQQGTRRNHQPQPAEETPGASASSASTHTTTSFSDNTDSLLSLLSLNTLEYTTTQKALKKLEADRKNLEKQLVAIVPANADLDRSIEFNPRAHSSPNEAIWDNAIQALPNIEGIWSGEIPSTRMQPSSSTSTFNQTSSARPVHSWWAQSSPNPVQNLSTPNQTSSATPWWTQPSPNPMQTLSNPNQSSSTLLSAWSTTSSPTYSPTQSSTLQLSSISTQPLPRHRLAPPPGFGTTTTTIQTSYTLPEPLRFHDLPSPDLSYEFGSSEPPSGELNYLPLINPSELPPPGPLYMALQSQIPPPPPEIRPLVKVSPEYPFGWPYDAQWTGMEELVDKLLLEEE